LAIAQGLRLAGEMLGPFPFIEQLLRERKAVGIALGIEARAGITIPVPGAADIGAGLEHAHAQAELAQAAELGHAGKTRADDDGMGVERGFWRGGGHPSVSSFVSQKASRSAVPEQMLWKHGGCSFPSGWRSCRK